MLPNILKNPTKKKKSKYCTLTTGSTDFLVFKRKKKLLRRNSHLLNFNHVLFNLPLRTQWNRIILPIEQESQDEHARAAGFQLSGSQINSTCFLIKKHVPALHMGHMCTKGFHFHSAFSLSTASTHKHPSYCTHQSILHAWESFCPFLFAVFVSPYQAVAQLLHVSGVTGCFSGQDTSMHCRMQGLHSAAQHLWMSSQFRHIPDTKQRLWELREGLTCCRYLQYCSSTCGRLRLWL